MTTEGATPERALTVPTRSQQRWMLRCSSTCQAHRRLTFRTETRRVMTREATTADPTAASLCRWAMTRQLPPTVGRRIRPFNSQRILAHESCATWVVAREAESPAPQAVAAAPAHQRDLLHPLQSHRHDLMRVPRPPESFRGISAQGIRVTGVRNSRARVRLARWRARRLAGIQSRSGRASGVALMASGSIELIQVMSPIATFTLKSLIRRPARCFRTFICDGPREQVDELED
jgi:hypothetical protein